MKQSLENLVLMTAALGPSSAITSIPGQFILGNLRFTHHTGGLITRVKAWTRPLLTEEVEALGLDVSQGSP